MGDLVETCSILVISASSASEPIFPPRPSESRFLRICRRPSRAVSSVEEGARKRRTEREEERERERERQREGEGERGREREREREREIDR